MTGDSHTMRIFLAYFCLFFGFISTSQIPEIPSIKELENNVNAEVSHEIFYLKKILIGSLKKLDRIMDVLGLLKKPGKTSQQYTQLLDTLNSQIKVYGTKIFEIKRAASVSEYERLVQEYDLAVLGIKKTLYTLETRPFLTLPKHFNLEDHLLKFVKECYKYHNLLLWTQKRKENKANDIDYLFETFQINDDPDEPTQFVNAKSLYEYLYMSVKNHSSNSFSRQNSFLASISEAKFNENEIKITTFLNENDLWDLISSDDETFETLNAIFSDSATNSLLYRPIEEMYGDEAFARLKPIQYLLKDAIKPEIYDRVNILLFKYLRYYCIYHYSANEADRKNFLELTKDCLQELRGIVPEENIDLDHILHALLHSFKDQIKNEMKLGKVDFNPLETGIEPKSKNPKEDAPKASKLSNAPESDLFMSFNLINSFIDSKTVSFTYNEKAPLAPTITKPTIQIKPPPTGPPKPLSPPEAPKNVPKPEPPLDDKKPPVPPKTEPPPITQPLNVPPTGPVIQPPPEKPIGKPLETPPVPPEKPTPPIITTPKPTVPPPEPPKGPPTAKPIVPPKPTVPPTPLSSTTQTGPGSEPILEPPTPPVPTDKDKIPPTTPPTPPVPSDKDKIPPVTPPTPPVPTDDDQIPPPKPLPIPPKVDINSLIKSLEEEEEKSESSEDPVEGGMNKKAAVAIAGILLLFVSVIIFAFVSFLKKRKND
jgi:hypothetical protein